MREFYKRVIERSESERTKDQERHKRESVLLEIKGERTIPKLRRIVKRNRKKKR